MTHFSILLSILLITSGYAQSDSVIVPATFRLAPSVRTVAAEASAFAFIYGAYGATVDVDLVALPFPTVQGAGFRFNYQEVRQGYVPAFSDNSRPIAYITSAFARATFTKGNSRSDVFLGVVSSDPRARHAKNQMQFGIEVSAQIVKPLSALFVRVTGRPGGASAQFGISIGYID